MIDMAANDEARKFYEEKVRAVIDDPDGRRSVDPQRPSDRHQANLHRHQLLSDVQQTQRDTGQCARRPRSSPSTPPGSTPPTRALRRRRDRARHGFRCDDGCAWPRSTSSAATGGGCATTGPTGRARIWVSASTGSPICSSVSGPGAPAVLANMVLHAEAHVNWIADAIDYLDGHGYAAIEATEDAVDGWVAECARRAEATLFTKANSWYMGANVPGKPRGLHAVRRRIRRLQPTSAPRSPTPATRDSTSSRQP